MTPEEESVLRQENSTLHEQVRSQQDLIERQARQIAMLTAQVEELHARLSKDSHNSHLPPSSDRFGRQPKSLRTKSEKHSGGQPGHPGSSLSFSSRSEEHTSELQSPCNLVCRLLLEKKK